MTLRSGQVLGTPEQSSPVENFEKEVSPESSPKASQASKDHEIKQVGKGSNPNVYMPRAPFPSCLESPSSFAFGKKGAKMEKMMELFKQVQINLPLLDVIKQVSAYAKFLKDLCTQKCKLKTHIPKTIHLTDQVSVVLSNQLPPKLKDPGAPLLACIIGNLPIKHVLLDLGVSVNILPSSVYDHFGFGELKPTKVILQLDNRSIKVPRCFIEDVLVKVDVLYFPMDFLVLDMKTPNNRKPQSIILGRPFLASTNACISCRSGAMDISFGPQHKEECFSVDVINEVVAECIPVMLVDDPLQQYLTFPGGDDFDINAYTVKVNVLLDAFSLLDHPSSTVKYE
ncbi:uncharacterized protein LOC122643543 [Telopea speciosissima]|uniref:uncharacterized protein LOC122643543 n=1 Tax=Telopea speciosissima TaxID=54955 RepID=UPI001CC50BD5|nr:uncharacterized protein LOC122643543 [Telopea speciosissima]